MSQKDTLVSRLLARPRDFELRELEKLLGLCGCTKSNAGRTSGSAIRYTYVRGNVKRVFSIHRPHPENTLKRYVLDGAIEFLKDIGAI